MEWMMGTFLLGAAMGILVNGCDQWLVKKMDEITEEKKWHICIIPVINGMLGVLSYGMSKTLIQMIFNIIWMSLFLLLFCFDLKYMLLPTKVIVPGMVITLLWLGLQFIMTDGSYGLVNGLLGGICGFGLFWLVFYGSLFILKKEGLGFGDVRLMGLIGLVVGLDKIFLTIVLASLLAVIVGIILYVIRNESRAFPFGPFLCSSAIIMTLFGEPIIHFYLSCMGYM